MPGWNWKKIKQMLNSTLGLNFSCLNIIHVLFPRYHLKTIAHILKNKRKSKRVFTHEIARLIIIKMKMKMKNRSHRYDIIDLGLDMDNNIVNLKSVSVSWCLYVLSNIQETFEVEFMKKLSNTEAEMKKSVAYKKVCSSGTVFTFLAFFKMILTYFKFK